MLLAIVLINKYVTKGWKEVQAWYAEREHPEVVGRLLAYLAAVERVKQLCDEDEVVLLIEEHRLEVEQLLTDHLKSKKVSLNGLSLITGSGGNSAVICNCDVIWDFIFI